MKNFNDELNTSKFSCLEAVKFQSQMKPLLQIFSITRIQIGQQVDEWLHFPLLEFLALFFKFLNDPD